MIIACPACTTRYVVPESAIGVEGRTVRCAKCRHSWHQDGPNIATPDFTKDTPKVAKNAADTIPAPQPRPDSIATPGFGDTHSVPEKKAHVRPSEPPAPATPLPPDPISPREPPRETPPQTVAAPASRLPSRSYADDDDDDGFSQFDRRPPFQSRRNPLRIWTAAGAIFAALALGTVFAVSYYGFPDWVPISRPTFAVAQPDLVLDFPADQQDRRTLPDGSEYFSASGTITNTGRETRSVPSILIVMRNERDVPVYSWVLAPPESSLAPGQSVTINEIATDVPKNAKYAEIGWNPS